jgi:hypothetical protein
MRKITIVGAGQSGLMIGVGLVRKGYDVTIVSDKTPEEIRNGRVTSSQGFQATPIAYERAVGLRLWEQDYKPWDGIEFNVLNPESKQKQFTFSSLISDVNGRPDWVVESIDQRVKMPAWIYKFEELGGKMVYETADLASLERYEAESDLVLVASGKGEIGKLLERDDEKSVFDKPQRALGLAYVKNLKPIETRDNGTIRRGLTWNAVPGVGEYFVCNALTTSGECDIMIFEGVPGGPMDILDTRDGPEKYFENCLKILKEFFPHEYERAKDSYLTDDLGILSGRFPPTIRKPVMKLPNGGLAMGVADAVCLNDPITGQGSCNAAKFAHIAIDAILKHGYRDFDEAFMQNMFDSYWETAEAVVNWTNSLLGELGPAQGKLLAAADQYQDMADFIIRGMDDANTLMPYWFDEQAADELIAKIAEQDAKAA